MRDHVLPDYHWPARLAAEYLGIGVRRLNRLVARGKIPVSGYVEGERRYSKRALDRYLHTCESVTKTDISFLNAGCNITKTLRISQDPTKKRTDPGRTRSVDFEQLRSVTSTKPEKRHREDTPVLLKNQGER